MPGSSAYFLGGVVSYSNEVKQHVLGVRAEDLKKYGAVSEQVSLQMAQGVRRLTGADFAVSTTGIAGPDGGTPEKPVGLVYIGCFCNGKTTVQQLNLRGGREAIRQRAAGRAVYQLVQRLTKENA